MKFIYTFSLLLLLASCTSKNNSYVCAKITNKNTVASLKIEGDKAIVKSEEYAFCGKIGNINYYMDKCNDNYKELAEVSFDVVSLQANVYYIGEMHCK